MYLTEVVAGDDLEVGGLRRLGGLLQGIGTVGIGLRVGLTYKQGLKRRIVLMLTAQRSSKSAEKVRQEWWRLAAFLHTLKPRRQHQEKRRSL